MARLTKKQRKSECRVYEAGGNAFIIQLVDIEFYPKMSEETLAFTATLELTGSEVFKFRCRNDGCGGCTDIVPDYDIINKVSVLFDDPEGNRKERMAKHWTAMREVDAFLKTQCDYSFYKVAKRYGWQVDKDKFVGKSLEGEVNNMLAEWCDKYNL